MFSSVKFLTCGLSGIGVFFVTLVMLIPSLSSAVALKFGENGFELEAGFCGCEECLLENDGVTANFVIINRWTRTATNANTGQEGDPVDLTWSIVPDGTQVDVGPNGARFSNLVARFDEAFDEPNAGTPDITNRFWFSLLEDSFESWARVSGVRFCYEPNDDGVRFRTLAGELGVRGDIRLAGGTIDRVGVQANANFPSTGDILYETGSDGIALSFTVPQGNFGPFQRMTAHEIGHTLGLRHVDSNDARFLMSGVPGGSGGPQLDDILGVQRLYGDFHEGLEKTDPVDDNDSIANATSFGELSVSGELALIGGDGGTGTAVDPDEVDFVSIDDNSDTDFYRVDLPARAEVSVTLAPVGEAYNVTPQTQGGDVPFFPRLQSNLTLAVFDDAGNLIQEVDQAGLGGAESITFTSSGEFSVRVQGQAAANQAEPVQLYLLAMTAQEIVCGDVNLDGVVDFLDIGPFIAILQAGSYSPQADCNLDGVVNFSDIPPFINALSGV